MWSVYRFHIEDPVLFAKALKGDARSANVLINLILGLEETRKAAGDPEELGEDDQAVLDSYQKRLLSDFQSTLEESTNDK